MAAEHDRLKSTVVEAEEEVKDLQQRVDGLLDDLHHREAELAEAQQKKIEAERRRNTSKRASNWRKRRTTEVRGASEEKLEMAGQHREIAKSQGRAENVAAAAIKRTLKGETAEATEKQGSRNLKTYGSRRCIVSELQLRATGCRAICG